MEYTIVVNNEDTITKYILKNKNGILIINNIEYVINPDINKLTKWAKEDYMMHCIQKYRNVEYIEINFNINDEYNKIKDKLSDNIRNDILLESYIDNNISEYLPDIAPLIDYNFNIALLLKILIKMFINNILPKVPFNYGIEFDIDYINYIISIGQPRNAKMYINNIDVMHTLY